MRALLVLLILASSASAQGVQVINDKSSGSGVVYKMDKEYAYILTAKHLVNKHADNKITVRWPNGKAAYARFVNKSEEHDLSLIFTLIPDGCDFAPLAKVPAEVNDKVYQVGYPGGVGPNFRTGTIIHKQSAFMATDYGDSGSGLYNLDGELVGITYMGNAVRNEYGEVIGTGTWFGPLLINIDSHKFLETVFVPVDQIRRFLECGK